MACFAHNAHAALLLYEGFNGYGTGNLSTKTPNSNTVGLNTSVAYAGNGVGDYTLSASSLSFGPNLPTTGGSVKTTATTSVAAAQMSLASAYQGTLYSSYLVNLDTRGGTALDGSLTRISTTTTSTGEHFLSMADSRSTSTAVAVGYDGTTVAAGASLTLDVTYLLIARFTRVGETVTVGNPGIATIYALNLAQFNSFVAAGANESYLDTTATGTGNNQIWARASDSYNGTSLTFTTGNFAHFVSVNGATSFDELRYGSTLFDVIPEPSVSLLALGGIGMLGFRRRARSASR